MEYAKNIILKKQPFTNDSHKFLGGIPYTVSINQTGTII